MYIYFFLSVLLTAICLVIYSAPKSYKPNAERVAKFIFLFVFLLFLSSVYGFRVIDHQHGGIDGLAYTYIYDRIGKDFSSIFDQRIEKGYALLLWINKSFGGSFNSFLMLYGMLIFPLYYYIASKVQKSSFSLMAYFLITLFVIDSFNISRMILSVFVLFVSVCFLSKRRYALSIIMTLIATSIQITSLIGIFFIAFFYFIEKVDSRPYLKVLVVVLGVICSFFVVEVFKGMLQSIGYDHYLNQEGEASYLNYLFATILIVFRLNLNEVNKLSELSKTIFNLLPTIYLIAPLYATVPIAYRFNYIYMLFFAMLIPVICEISWENILRRKVVYSGWFVVATGYFFLKSISFFGSGVNSALIWKISNSWYIL